MSVVCPWLTVAGRSGLSVVVWLVGMENGAEAGLGFLAALPPPVCEAAIRKDRSVGGFMQLVAFWSPSAYKTEPDPEREIPSSGDLRNRVR